MAGPNDDPFKGYSNRPPGRLRQAFIRPADPALARIDAERRAMPGSAQAKQGKVNQDVSSPRPQPQLRMRGSIGLGVDRAVANRRALEQRREEARQKLAEQRRQQVQLKEKFQGKARE